MFLCCVSLTLASCGDNLAGDCGDGNHNANEQCDDGNVNAGDGCSKTCQI